MKLFVGLDVSSDKLDACFLTDTLTILHQGSYANEVLLQSFKSTIK